MINDGGLMMTKVTNIFLVNLAFHVPIPENLGVYLRKP
jgi:hypothetical protein